MKLMYYVLLLKLSSMIGNLLVRFLKLYVHIKPQKNKLIENMIVKIFDTGHNLLKKIYNYQIKLQAKIIWINMMNKKR